MMKGTNAVKILLLRDELTFVLERTTDSDSRAKLLTLQTTLALLAADVDEIEHAPAWVVVLQMLTYQVCLAIVSVGWIIRSVVNPATTITKLYAYSSASLAELLNTANIDSFVTTRNSATFPFTQRLERLRKEMKRYMEKYDNDND